LPDQAGPGAKDEQIIDPLPRTPSARTPNYQTGRVNDRPVEAFKRRCPVVPAEENGSDASRHSRQPRPHRRAELSGERRNVADIKLELKITSAMYRYIDVFQNLGNIDAFDVSSLPITTWQERISVS